MNLKQARYIKTIADEHSISAAAKKLYVSQPSLSQMLGQVEEELGVPLFKRGRMSFEPTYAGERYLEAANVMLNAEEKLDNEISEIRQDKRGKLRMGMSIQRALYILPAVLPGFFCAHPNIQFELTEGNSAKLEAMALEGTLDVAFVSTEVTNTALSYRLIQMERIGILTGPDSHLAKTVAPGTPVYLNQIADGDFVMLKQGHNIRTIQNQLFQRYNLKPHIVLETDVLEIARSVTMGCSYYMLCSDCYDSADGVFYPLADYDNVRHYYACKRAKDQRLSYADDFVERVRKFLAGEE